MVEQWSGAVLAEASAAPTQKAQAAAVRADHSPDHRCQANDLRGTEAGQAVRRQCARCGLPASQEAW